MRPAEVRFYFDADILGLARTICALGADCTYPGDAGAVNHKRERPPCTITPQTPDLVWIPVVAKSGWLMVTRDTNIRNHVAALSAVMDTGGRMVALASQDARDVWSQLEVTDGPVARHSGTSRPTSTIRVHRYKNYFASSGRLEAPMFVVTIHMAGRNDLRYEDRHQGLLSGLSDLAGAS